MGPPFQRADPGQIELFKVREPWLTKENLPYDLTPFEVVCDIVAIEFLNYLITWSLITRYLPHFGTLFPIPVYK